MEWAGGFVVCCCCSGGVSVVWVAVDISTLPVICRPDDANRSLQFLRSSEHMVFESERFLGSMWSGLGGGGCGCVDGGDVDDGRGERREANE